MSKMNELSQVLDELISCGEKMIQTTNAIKECFTEEAETVAEPMKKAKPVKEEAKAPEVTEPTYSTKKWERIESYDPKFMENIVQAVSRDLLCYAMHNLSGQQICGHVHDELIIECPKKMSVESITSIMSKSPDWMKDILICGDGYATPWYKKD